MIKNTINDAFFEVLGPEQAYFLGLMAADGCIVKPGVRFSLSQSGPEGLTLIKHIKRMLAFTGPIYHSHNAHTITVTSPVGVSVLEGHGIVAKKSLVLKYPADLPPALDSYFLRGYFDGDGCLGYYANGKKTHSLMLSFVGTPEFIRIAATKLPVKGKIRIIEKAANLSEFRVYNHKAQQLYQYLYVDTPKVSVVSPKQTKYNAIEWQTRIRSRYTPLREKALKMLGEGLGPMQIAKALDLPFQTIYKWRHNGTRNPAIPT